MGDRGRALRYLGRVRFEVHVRVHCFEVSGSPSKELDGKTVPAQPSVSEAKVLQILRFQACHLKKPLHALSVSLTTVNLGEFPVKPVKFR